MGAHATLNQYRATLFHSRANKLFDACGRLRCFCFFDSAATVLTAVFSTITVPLAAACGATGLNGALCVLYA